MWTGSAMADPETPATSDQAQQAYLDSSHRAGALNEQVLQAQENQKKATAAVTAAADKVKSSTAAAAKAKEDAARAARAAESYRAKVDAFANASFRGARLSEMSVLLTAGSADDFLDQVTSLDRVAADTQATLDAALAARKAAAQAQTNAEASRAAAEKAKTDADAAQAAAAKATEDVTARKATLDAEAARYRALYESLSEQERQAAAEAERRANEQAAAEAAAAAQAAQEQAAQEQAAQEQAAQEQAAAPEPALVAADRADRTPLAQDPQPQDPAPAPEAPAPSQESSQAPVEQAPVAPAGSSAGAAAVAAALSKEGSPYVYGAAGPDAFDCSGLTSWAWAQAGVTIPRTSGEQAGLPEVPLDQLQPGDLVTYYSPVSHVAMYIGNGQVIHASTETRPVYITSVTGAGPNPTGHRVTG
jgi:cell wall-associated NlpC family hydrolase